MIYSTKLSFGALLVSSLALHAHAHAAIAPALGVEGTPVRGDVQRPSTAEPCGNVPISDINTSTAVPLGADGSADFTITNFNAGTDGSRQVTAQVDPTGTGKSFEDATVTTNGDGDPTNVGSQPLVVQLPAGIQCTGGDAGNLCLMSFKTTAGFGNCAVVSQGAGSVSGGAKATTGAAAGAAKGGKGGAAKGNAAAPAAASATATASASTGATASDAGAAEANNGQGAAKGGAHHKGAKGKGQGKGKGAANGKGQAAGAAAAAEATAAKTANTPAGARAVRSFLSASGGEAIAKRGLPWSWIWA